MSTSCHVCEQPSNDTCVRCERATCDEHFYDQHQLGVCQTCVDEIERAGGPTFWRYPLRRPLDAEPTGGPDADPPTETDPELNAGPTA